MIDELYAVHVAGSEYDIVDFEDGTHLVIDGRNVYSLTLEACKPPCLCGQQYVCSCGLEVECPHIRAIHKYYREVGDE